MKHKIFILLAMLIAMPILFADPVINEVEIELMEVAGAGFIGGDDPLDSPREEGTNPPQPTDFHCAQPAVRRRHNGATRHHRQPLHRNPERRYDPRRNVQRILTHSAP